MAPLTRNRAVRPGMVPSPIAVDYYGQRASAGLLITEASQVSQQGQGYQDTPGIYSTEQTAGWRKVTDRVHERGGRIFIQIWHVGRISHTSFQPGGGAPVAPSAVRAKARTFVNGTFTEVSEVVAAEIGADRTGIRISPLTPVDDGSDSNPQPLFDHIVDQLNQLKLLYIHVIEGATGGLRDVAPFDYASLPRRFKQAYIANNGYDFELATRHSRAAPPT